MAPTMVEKTSTAVSPRMTGQSFCSKAAVVACAGALIDHGRVRSSWSLSAVGGLNLTPRFEESLMRLLTPMRGGMGHGDDPIYLRTRRRQWVRSGVLRQADVY